MKTVLAALAVASALVAVPALAAEPAFALRGGAEAGPASAVARRGGEAKPAFGSAAAARKVRVVLASPYGN